MSFGDFYIIKVNQINLNIEALIFSSEEPITIEELQVSLTKIAGIEISQFEIENIVRELSAKYHEGDFAFELVPLAGGYQFLTKPEYHLAVSELLKNKLNKKLSTNSLETLSIIAYKQPVTKSEIEQIRGVNCDYTIQKLLEKDLISITGRSETVGKSLLYGTSPFFMNYFGLNSVDELPKLKDLEKPEPNMIGVLSDN